MASEERLRELEEKYEGFTVYDNQGSKIGKVDDLFVDESDSEEYIGVKMGFLGSKSTLIPTEVVRVNENDRTIEVAESKDHVKDAPSFDDDEEVTSEYEERIRRHFGLESLEASPDRDPAAASGGAEAGPGDGEEGHGSTDEAGAPEGSSGSTGGVADQDQRAETEAGYSGGSESDEGVATGPAEHSDEEEGGSETGARQGDGEYSGTSPEEQRPGDSDEGSPTGSTPTTSRQTEETERFQEGGRTKIRRRIIREEVVDADDE